MNIVYKITSSLDSYFYIGVTCSYSSIEKYHISGYYGGGKDVKINQLITFQKCINDFDNYQINDLIYDLEEKCKEKSYWRKIFKKYIQIYSKEELLIFINNLTHKHFKTSSPLLSFLHIWFNTNDINPYNREILHICETVKDAYIKEADLVNYRIVSDPFCLNIQTGGGNYFQKTNKVQPLRVISIQKPNDVKIKKKFGKYLKQLLDSGIDYNDINHNIEIHKEEFIKINPSLDMDFIIL